VLIHVLLEMRHTAVHVVPTTPPVSTPHVPTVLTATCRPLMRQHHSSPLHVLKTPPHTWISTPPCLKTSAVAVSSDRFIRDSHPPLLPYPTSLVYPTPQAAGLPNNSAGHPNNSVAANQSRRSRIYKPQVKQQTLVALLSDRSFRKAGC
jgi:hypothetical protein